MLLCSYEHSDRWNALLEGQDHHVIVLTSKSSLFEQGAAVSPKTMG